MKNIWSYIYEYFISVLFWPCLRLVFATNCKSKSIGRTKQRFPGEKYSWHKFLSVKDNIELRKLWTATIPRSEADGTFHRTKLDCATNIFIRQVFELMYQNINVTHNNSDVGFMKNAQLKQRCCTPGCPAYLTKTRSQRPTRLFLILFMHFYPGRWQPTQSQCNSDLTAWTGQTFTTHTTWNTELFQ